MSDSEDSRYTCELCGENCDLDIKDEIEEGTIRVNEWLSVDAKCDFCQKIGCYKCLKTCYTCSNNGYDEKNQTICLYCLKKKKRNLTNISCKYHEWWNCDKHKNEKCGECSSNKNYDRYGF